MDYENFKEQFVEDVKEKLYEQGTEVDITVNTVNKLNESYEATHMVIIRCPEESERLFQMERSSFDGQQFTIMKKLRA